MSGFQLRYLGYFGPDKPPASLSFAPGLNVICGASETGKSFVVESIDFMLGQEDPVRDIPERAGYDRVRLVIESDAHAPLTLDRSTEGGHYRAYSELLGDGEPTGSAQQLRFKHAHARVDTVSFELLQRTGLTARVLRKSATDTRSLSFRDLARLCVVDEEDVQRRGSPLLSGQFTGATAEFAAFKLLLTGADDSALVTSKDDATQQQQQTGKVELLNQWIDALQADLDERGADPDELHDQLARLESNISAYNDELATAQKSLGDLMERRASLAGEIRTHSGRLSEIGELIARFALLDDHYKTDLARLEAIRESGSLFVHLEQGICPLCGSEPGDQHLEADCDGNTEAVVAAARAEMGKINRLRSELAQTLRALNGEQDAIRATLRTLRADHAAYEKELTEIAAPAVSQQRASYNDLVSKRADVRQTIEKIDRLKDLIDQRDELTGDKAGTEDVPKSRTQIPKNVLDEFAQAIEHILQEWHYPNATRVFFDPEKRDIQIAGKDRGSTGKGLRAVTHAAVTIGLMEFCRDRHLPHPGFVVLDSPLLAYWKPEGAEDDLRGTDLKEMFYRYLLGISRSNQVIVVENEHPPDFVSEHVTVFTKNPQQGRYGFFPHAG